jgi:hypothetical protein
MKCPLSGVGLVLFAAVHEAPFDVLHFQEKPFDSVSLLNRQKKKFSIPIYLARSSNVRQSFFAA